MRFHYYLKNESYYTKAQALSCFPEWVRFLKTDCATKDMADIINIIYCIQFEYSS